MKSTTSHEDQYAPEPTPAEEEAWREIEKRQSDGKTRVVPEYQTGGALTWEDAGTPAVVRPITQYRKAQCADWYDGYPDHSDGGGPYETRTLYTAPVAAQGAGTALNRYHASGADWLLPCPFCGGKAELSVADETVNVRCEGWNPGVCLGAGPNCYTEAEAIAGWNRRAQLQPSGNAGESDDERSAFESWAKKCGYQRDELARSNMGIVSPEYFNQNTEYAWKAWQARAALAAQSSGQHAQDPLQPAVEHLLDQGRGTFQIAAALGIGYSRAQRLVDATVKARAAAKGEA